VTLDVVVVAGGTRAGDVTFHVVLIGRTRARDVTLHVLVVSGTRAGDVTLHVFLGVLTHDRSFPRFAGLVWLLSEASWLERYDAVAMPTGHLSYTRHSPTANINTRERR
jgi:hypothetical protein